MSDISPEDREALVMIKYGELFDKTLALRMQNPAFVQELKKAIDSLQGEQRPPQERQEGQQPPPRQPSGKRNLLEVALGL